MKKNVCSGALSNSSIKEQNRNNPNCTNNYNNYLSYPSSSINKSGIHFRNNRLFYKWNKKISRRSK